jgi:putative heme-binding domain-containing protein
MLCAARLLISPAAFLATAAAVFAQTATPADQISVPAGFKVELLRSATAREGSWVAMTIDPKGRLYLSPQGKAPDGGIMRVTLGSGAQIEKTEWLKPDVGAAMGMLWAFDSLYVSGQGPDGQAIYRLRDTDGDDRLDAATLFKKVPGGGGEHGAHALVAGPDGKLYIAHGNSTPLVEGLAPDSPFRHWAEDDLLPRVMDPVATFFDKLKAPYGYILRADPDGQKWELFAAGFRNQYDIDFNADGELFTYDSDMEWDAGLPWYRPTRVLHITSGAEFGFREGSAKWPDHYPDSLPAAVDIGLGSPTGVKFGTRSNFPQKYQRALFVMDWTFGRILAVHLAPRGASYDGTFEEFAKGKGLPVTDLEFGPDGAMYFITGGRGTQAGLYRVSYVGSSDKPIAAPGADGKTVESRTEQARALRRQLESFHGTVPAAGATAVLPHLHHEDRHIRFAARVALEALPAEQWRDLALEMKDARAGLTALLALARCGTRADQEPLLRALARWPLDSLDEPLQLAKLRVIQVTFARHGRPSDEMVKLAVEKLGRQYPAKSFVLNRELSQLLVWLGAPDAVEKTLSLMETSAKQEEQIWFATCLRAATAGWTPTLRERYFAWFNKARGYKGGNSFAKFIERIKEQALAKVPDPERAGLAAVLSAPPASAQPAAVGPQRNFVQAWTVADLAPALEEASRGRDFARGKEIFSSTLCLKCHRFGNEGGSVGPDLSAVGSRFNRRDLLEAIIEPSKALSEQYASFIITTRKGDTVMGQIVEENNDRTTVVTDAIAGTSQDIPRTHIQSKQPAPVSLMPPGLLNVLKKEEVLDLLAYIESGGNAAAPQFRAER